MDSGLRISWYCQETDGEEHSREKGQHVQGPSGRRVWTGKLKADWCHLGGNGGKLDQRETGGYAGRPGRHDSDNSRKQ